MAVGIVEVGSTITKLYVATHGEVVAAGMTNIQFKKHYSESGNILRSDIEQLAGAVEGLLASVPMVHVYGTSIFRDAPAEEVERVESRLARLGAVTFSVVTADMESDYTAIGAIRGLTYAGPVAVMVGGGGSIEVSVHEHSRVIGRANSPIGVVDVTHRFPDLCSSTTNTPTAEVIEWVADRIAPIGLHAEILVLAGGDFPLLYENAGYHLRPNPYSSDSQKPYLLLNSDKLAQDEKFFHDLDLTAFKALTPEAPGWWDGARAMCSCVSAVAAQLEARLLVPTRVSMVFGIADMLALAVEETRPAEDIVSP